jgi:hypothetical protein
LRTIIPRLRDRGYEYVTVTELLDAATQTKTASVSARVGWRLRRAQGRIVQLHARHAARGETRTHPSRSLESQSRSHT